MNDFETKVLEGLAAQRSDISHMRSLFSSFEKRFDDKILALETHINKRIDTLEIRLKEDEDYVRTAAESVADLANLTTEALTESKLTNEKMQSFEKNVGKDVNKLILEVENVKMRQDMHSADIQDNNLKLVRLENLPDQVKELQKKQVELEKKDLSQDANLSNVNKFAKYFFDKLLIPLAVFIFAVAVYMKDKT